MKTWKLPDWIRIDREDQFDRYNHRLLLQFVHSLDSILSLIFILLNVRVQTFLGRKVYFWVCKRDYAMSELRRSSQANVAHIQKPKRKWYEPIFESLTTAYDRVTGGK